MEFFRARYRREDGSEYTMDFAAWGATDRFGSEAALWKWASSKAATESIAFSDRIMSLEYLGEVEF